MRKTGSCKRLLSLLLALAIFVSTVPMSVWAVDAGDFSTTGVTGLVGDIDTADTINWPIKIYDYLNDGMLFEYSSALHTAAYAPEGAAYGGGTNMPTTDIIGNDYTFYYSGQKTGDGTTAATYIDPYQEKAFTYWLDAHPNFNAVKGGEGDIGELKYLRLTPEADTTANTPPVVLSDFLRDNSVSGYSRDKIRYAAIVYRTNVTGAKVNLAWSTNYTGDKVTYLEYDGSTAVTPTGGTLSYLYRGGVDLVASTGTEWKSIVIDMKAGTIGELWETGEVTSADTVLMDIVGMTQADDQWLDISHVAYFSAEAEAGNYADDARNFANNPGEYLLDQTYTTEETTSVTDPAESAYAIDFPENAKYFSSSPYTDWGTSAGQGTYDGKAYATLNMTTADSGSNDGGVNSAYFATDLGLSRTNARYITMVYRTKNVTSGAQIGFWVEGTGTNNGTYDVNMAGAGSTSYTRLVTLPQSTGDEWIFFTYDLSWITENDPDFPYMSTFTNIGAYFPHEGTLEIAYIDYDATLEEAHTFAEDAVNYMNNNTTVAAAPTGGSSNLVNFTVSGNSKTNFTSIFKDTWSSTIYYADALTVKDISTTNKGYLNISTDASIYENSDSDYERTYLMVHDGGVSKTSNDFVTIVYRTHNITSSDKIGFWVEFATGAGSGAGMGNRGNQYTTLTTLTTSETKWVSQTFDLAALITDTDYDKSAYSTIYRIGVFLPGFTNDTQSMDIAYIDYHSTQALGEAFGTAAAAYMNSGSTSASGGGTYTKHWNMGSNAGFTMLLPAGGGGWATDNIRGGANDWTNGYFSYNIGITNADGVDDEGNTVTDKYNPYWDFDDDRDTARELGYVVSDDIFTLQPKNAIDTSGLELGYHLYNTAVAGPYTIGLLESGLSTVTKDGQSYKVLQYKNDTIDYIAQMLEATLKIPQTDQYGNYNYTFVQGSKSDQFAYTWDGTEAVAGVDGAATVDLATALRKRLGISFESTDYTGGKVLSDAATIADRGTAAGLDDAKRLALIGSFEECVGEIDSFAAAAYYLLHNLFVDNSYNQLQDDFKYLQLSKATIADDDTDSTNNKKAYVFDAGFTTGDATYTYDWDVGGYVDASGNTVDEATIAAYLKTSPSGVDYSPLVKADGTAGTGIISLTGATTKDEIFYSGTYDTTRFPFLPVIIDDNGDEYDTKTPAYFAEDQADSVLAEGAGYADRNYNYVMQANGEFIFQSQDALFFEFAGDDDVYLFINNELVLDIGGAHSITQVKFDMNDYVLKAQEILAPLAAYGYAAGMAEDDFKTTLANAKAAGVTDTISDAEYLRWHKLNLVDGESYAIDFYYMERHGWGANMRIVTNIVMTDPALGCVKTAYQDGAEIAYDGNVDDTRPIEYSFALTNNGNSKLYNLTFDDRDIGVKLDAVDGLTVSNKDYVKDANGNELDATDLVAYVDGFYEDGTPYETIKVTFADNAALISFMKELSGDGLQSGTGTGHSGGGLWQGSTVTIRGIWYTMTTAQQNADKFENTVYISATPALEGGSTINSEAKHRVRAIAGAIHFYQWAGHPITLNRTVVKSLLSGYTTAVDQFLMIPSSGTQTANGYIDYTYAEVSNYGDMVNKELTVNYTTPGTKLFYIKVMADADKDGIPDVRENYNDDGTLKTGDDNTYDRLVPVIIHVTDVADSTVVLDYGLKADLMDEGGILANDSVGVANIDTTVTPMGISAGEPGYLSQFTEALYALGNVNRISMTPDADSSVALSDGTYAIEDGTLTFTPTDFMDASYDVWAAITVHNSAKTPSSVGPANTSAKTYSIDITNEVQMYQKVTVLPANVVYYEDDFAGMTYTTGGTFTKVDDGSGSLTQSVDQSMPYGQDPVYQDTADNSMSGNSVYQYPVKDGSVFASFTFTGTGFEIISRTDTAFGVMLASVYAADDTTNALYQIPVVTEFDNISNGASAGNEKIYQVPVIRVDYLGTDTNSDGVKEPATYVVKLSGIPYLDTDTDGDGLPNDPESNWCISEGLTYATILSLVDAKNNVWITHEQVKTWYQDELLNEKEYAYLEQLNPATGKQYEKQELLNMLVKLLHPPKADAKSYNLWIDGVRIFQPLGASNPAYTAAESGASFEEMRELLIDKKLAFINLYSPSKEFTACTGNLIWTENRNGEEKEDGTIYKSTLVDSINDYVVSGPNNELYFRRTGAETGTTDSEGNVIKNFQVLLLYVQEDDVDTTVGSLQIGVRSIDNNLFQNKTAGSSIKMQFRYIKENGTTDVEEDIVYVNSSTEQYFTINYTNCPYTEVDGKKVYTVMLLARTSDSTGMLSFTSLKHNGLVIKNIVDIPATDENGLPTGDELMTGATWYYAADGTLQTSTGTSASAHFDMRALSKTMDQILAAEQAPEVEPDVPQEPGIPDETNPSQVTLQPLTGTVSQTPAKEGPSALTVALLAAGVIALLGAAYLLTKKYLHYL